MKYRCLVLDHDDTVVKSTPEIHYPAFKIMLAKYRPDIKLTFEEFSGYCYFPGFYPFCREILHFSDEEMAIQLSEWKKYVMSHIPSCCDGMERVIRRQKENGGLVCVVSHSCDEMIERDYRVNFGIMPDKIFGWELGEDKRKPNPYPLMEIMRAYDLSPADLIVVDDLKPGRDMARCCNVDFAGAGWGNSVPAVAAKMEEISDYYFKSVPELEKFLFD